MPETEIVKAMTEINDHGPVLHLCVCYNHLEALKILVESMRGDIDQILSSKDREGNTVLDLAIKRGQIKMIKYLISLSEVSDTINTSKSEALRALDMLEDYPRDFISHTIQHISNEERAPTSSNISSAQVQQDHATQPNHFPQQLQINDHEQSQTPSPNNDPPQNQQPSQNIDPPQSLPINDPLVQSPITHPLQLTNPFPQNYPSQPSSHNPSPSNTPQHPHSPSPHNDPSQPSSHNPSPSNVPLQPPPFSPSDDPSQPSPTPRIANDPQHERTRWDTVEEF
ncbi:ankyrin repeat-containing protein, partial [Trifolium medium]|nr:ankyrin repeat-containing protein [Trifolium medium]